MEDIEKWNEVFGSDVKQNFVCHYTSKETLLEHILPNRSIRLGTFDTVNDPWESQDWCFTEIEDRPPPRITFINPREMALKAKQANFFAKRLCKLFCVTRDDPNYPGADKTIFYRAYARPRMWAQYGNNHQGVCLVFDKEAFHVAINNQLGKVCDVLYDDVSYHPWDDEANEEIFELSSHAIETQGLEKAITDHIRKHANHFFFSKAPDWQHETESRWLLLSKRPGPAYVNFQDSLKGIVLGSKFHRSYVPSIESMRHGLSAKIARMQWHNGMPKLNRVY